ncbi:hypothetical protein, partial [Escherichia coli]|uniref:hypothetical protein n=1 Tax=Escherichia coli TaxID=562 RepID=UPI001BDC95E1
LHQSYKAPYIPSRKVSPITVEAVYGRGNIRLFFVHLVGERRARSVILTMICDFLVVLQRK